MDYSAALNGIGAAKEKKPRILVELRNCSIAFAGISQETRLVYSTLSNLPNLQVVGLLNPFHDLILPRSLRSAGRLSQEDDHQWRAMLKQSRLVSALDCEIQGVRRKNIVHKLWKILNKKDAVRAVIKAFYMGRSYEMLKLNGGIFGDFVFSKYFQQTLPASELQKVMKTAFYTIEKGWIEAHYGCRKSRTSVKLDTRDCDLFLCQVPTPFTVSDRTKIVVRYHDSIPLLLPHTVELKESKMFSWRLRASIRNGAFFACTSDPVRQELVRFFPETEANSCVIPDMVSEQFYKDVPSQEKVGEIIHRRKCPETAPKQLVACRPRYIKDAYVISVSTLEPRKNYGLLLQAWALACHRLETRPVLVLVANLGWRNREDVQELTPLVKAGRVAHLTRVAQHELRALYSGAHAVVCPSRSEGFDLPGVEAMLCDTPVIASDIDVHRWVYGDAATYFSTYDVSSCADAMVRALSTRKETGYLADLRRRGLERSTLYSPEAIGPQWAELFQQLAGGGAARRAKRIGVAATGRENRPPKRMPFDMSKLT